MHQIHDFADRLDVLLELRIFYYQRWRDLEHHEIVATDLRENSLVPKQMHHDHLSEHRRMNPCKSSERDSKSQPLRRAELDRGEHPDAANLVDHFVAVEARDQWPGRVEAHRRLTVPAGLQQDVDRRRTGTSHFVSQRREADEVRILSGVFEAHTTGTPIGILIENTDARSRDYDKLSDRYPPGHADYTYMQKYGVRD